MRIGLNLVALAANLFTSEAAAAHHPFVGEHADASAVHHPNGTISQRMTPKPAAFNKHAEFISRNGEVFKHEEEGPISRLSHAIFGKYETDFEKRVHDYQERRRNEQKQEYQSAYSGSSKRLGAGANFATILTNTDGFMWTGEIYMGKLSKMDVVYDTGSDWLTVEGADCGSCEGNTYDIGPSVDSGIAKPVKTEQSIRAYGSAELKGREYTDTVCILFSACVRDFEFFYIEEQRGIREPIDGILGMSRNKPFHLAPEEGNKTGPLYVEHLAKEGVISANKFSFYFTQPGSLSWVDLGEPVQGNIKTGAKIETVQLLKEDFFWGAFCEGVAIGDTSDANSYAWAELEGYSTWQPNNSFYSIIDTGSTAIMVSAVYFESLVLAIFEKVPEAQWQFLEQEGVILTECNHEYPSVFFLFDGYWIEAAPKDYVFAVDDTQTQCIFFILPAGMAMNVIGMPLFVDYYTIHDPETGTVGYVPHTTSNKSDIVPGYASKTQFLEVSALENSIDGTALFISWSICLILMYLIFDYWNAFLRESWQKSLSETAFLAVTAVFFAAVIIIFVFLIQPLIYSALKSSLEEQAQASYRKARLNMVGSSVLTYEHELIIGAAIASGLTIGYLVRPFLYRTRQSTKAVEGEKLIVSSQ